MELTAIPGDSKATAAFGLFPMAISPVGRDKERRYRGRSGNRMKRSLILIALLIAGILLPAIGPAVGSDVKPWRYTTRNQELPFLRGEQAQSVWASGAC